jgi:NADH:ubiquinone oxidoreductase subunit K
VLFIIAITAAEVGVGLAIVMMIYRQRSTVNVDDLQLMKW